MRKFFSIILFVLLSPGLTVQASYLPQGQIASLVRTYIMNRLGGGEDKFQVEVLNIPQDIDTGWELQVVPSSRKSYLGTYLVKLRAFSQGVLVKEVPLIVRVREVGKVLVATKLIKRYEVLTEDKVAWEEREIPPFIRHPLRNLEEVVGKRAKRGINRGEVVTADLVEVPPLVGKGQVVELSLKHPGFSLRTKGKALEDGWEGDVIRVRVLASGKRLSARIEKGEVQILN